MIWAVFVMMSLLLLCFKDTTDIEDIIIKTASPLAERHATAFL